MENQQFAFTYSLAKTLLFSVLCLHLSTLSANDDFILPPLEEVETPLSQDRPIFISRYNVTGNTRLSDDLINEILAPYSNREISFTELSALRDELTMAYVQRGYINSGAVIPDQDMQNNVVNIDIIEGKLSTINIDNDGRLKESYLRNRINLDDTDNIVNLHTLESKLQSLKQNKLIENLETNLLPGDQRGESVLTVNVEEAKPYHWQIEANNYSSPAVGAETLKLGFQHHNLTGYGDSISLGAKKSKQSHSVNIDYEVPLGINTTASISLQNSEATPEQKDLEILRNKSSSDVYSLGFNHSIISSVNSDFSIFGSVDRIQNDAAIDIEAEDINANITKTDASVDLLRLGLNWSERNRSQALSMRSTLSYGRESQLSYRLNSDNERVDVNTEKSNFFKWLGQVQYARRMNTLDSQLILRTDIQLASKNLLTGFEDFSIGGHNSVRGFRENLVSSERGALASLEWRVPLYKSVEKNASLQLAPFLDYGYVESSDDDDSEIISSVGLGALWNNKYSDISVYYGYALSDIDDNNGDDLQDDGIHFRAAFNF